MIYEVLLDGKTLYYPGDQECAIFNSKLEQALNDAGTFEFDVPVTNPLHDSIENRRSMVQILKDDTEIFYGEVRESEDDDNMTKSVYAVGELAFLYDSIQPQAKYQDQTPLQFFTTLINNHNAQVEEKKQFKVGVVTVTDPNDSIYRFTNYEDTLTCLREKLCESLGGYLRVRKVAGVRYLDLVKLQDYGTTCEQPIEFGENLLDYACNTSGVDIVTAVIPLGARLDESPIEGLDAYTDIKSVNDGKDYVYLPEAVSRFGWAKKVVHWDDVTEPENLKKKAEEWLKENQYELLTLEVNAVDLSMLDSNIDAFNLGDSVNALAEPYGMDAWFPVQKMTTYLQEPEKNELVLSNTLKKSYTQQMASLTNQLDEKIPQQSTILQMAKNNASELIKTATNGYIVLNMDDDGNPKELLIMDTKDIDTAQKVWRWNINGLGYSNTGYNGLYGLALTMDGRIVADFITTGTMYADRIKGGTLTLGGYDNDNGILEVRDASGNVCARISVLGINVNDKFMVDLNGHMKCIDGEFEGTIKSANAEITGGTIYIDTTEADGQLIKISSTANDNELFAGMGAYGFAAHYNGDGTTVMWHGIEIPDGGHLTYSGGKSIVGATEGYLGTAVIDTLSATTGHIGTLTTDSSSATTSDRNVKHAVKSLDKKQAAEFVYSLRPCRYKYNNGTSDRYHHGLIAQELKKAMGDNDWGVYVEDTDKKKGIRYEELIADLIATVQYQQVQIDKLKEDKKDE